LKALVTGAGGFIGAHLAAAPVASGARVRLLALDEVRVARLECAAMAAIG
jgi:nucleoside-diphosphate-sugar epimerase